MLRWIHKLPLAVRADRIALLIVCDKGLAAEELRTAGRIKARASAASAASATAAAATAVAPAAATAAAAARQVVILLRVVVPVARIQNIVVLRKSLQNGVKRCLQLRETCARRCPLEHRKRIADAVELRSARDTVHAVHKIRGLPPL